MEFKLDGIYGNGNISIETSEDGSSVFTSTLERETCPCCTLPECALDCEASKTENKESVEDVQNRLLFNLGLDVIEAYTGALVVALREKGFNLEDENLKEAFKESIETTLDAIANNT